MHSQSLTASQILCFVEFVTLSIIIVLDFGEEFIEAVLRTKK